MPCYLIATVTHFSEAATPNKKVIYQKSYLYEKNQLNQVIHGHRASDVQNCTIGKFTLPKSGERIGQESDDLEIPRELLFKRKKQCKRLICQNQN